VKRLSCEKRAHIRNVYLTRARVTLFNGRRVYVPHVSCEMIIIIISSRVIIRVESFSIKTLERSYTRLNDARRTYIGSFLFFFIDNDLTVSCTITCPRPFFRDILPIPKNYSYTHAYKHTNIRTYTVYPV